MRRLKNNTSFWLFLLGLGSCTQIYLYGCIAISELVAFVIAPVLYVKYFQELWRFGFTKFLNMVLLVIVSMLLSSWYNHTAFPFVFKSFASIYSVWAYFVVFYVLFRRNLNGLRWVFVGAFISSIITIYAFNPTAQVAESGSAYVGDASSEEVIGGALFWVGKFRELAQIPVCGFYLGFPLVLSACVPIVYLSIALATTTSGRAGSIALLISGAMIIIGRKNRRSMSLIGKHFFMCLLLGVIALFAIKQIYVAAAKNGLLSDAARAKYEYQSRQGSGIISLLVHGRTGFFTAIPAALHRPIIGYGPNAEDVGGYAKQFILKYGDETDIARFVDMELRCMRLGLRRTIPTHSYIMGAWVHYGIVGFIFYVWVLYVIARHIKRYAAAIPQWYGYFAMLLPYYLWNIFFSPFGSRWQFSLLMSCLFFAKAVGDGLMPLSFEMLKEVEKHER